MLVCLDKSIGGLVASDEPMGPEYLECDGHEIFRRDYPELFRARDIRGDAACLPDFRRMLDGIRFYVITG